MNKEPHESEKQNFGYIYLIIQDIYFKIGRTNDSTRREKSYKTHNPCFDKFTLTFKVYDEKFAERNIHKKLKKIYEHRGEWY